MAGLGPVAAPMAYLIFADREQEFDRRELSGPMVLGRAPECDFTVRDIILSRRHCLIEQIAGEWVVADLGSKNGTFVNGQPVTRHVLQDGDLIRIGRTRVCFQVGAFVPPPANLPRRQGARPADPHEALASTVTGFRLGEDEENLDQEVLATFPRPKPQPVEPAAFGQDQVYEMLSGIASSSWDSILLDKPRRAAVVELPTPKVTSTAPATPAPPVPEGLIASAEAHKDEDTRRRRALAARALLLATVGCAAAIALLGLWVISHDLLDW